MFRTKKVIAVIATLSAMIVSTAQPIWHACAKTEAVEAVYLAETGISDPNGRPAKPREILKRAPMTEEIYVYSDKDCKFRADFGITGEMLVIIDQVMDNSYKVVIPNKEGHYYLKMSGIPMTLVAHVEEARLVGDVNNDKKVDSIDAGEALALYANYSINAPDSMNYGNIGVVDVNFDGRVDPTDATSILTYYAHMSSTDEPYKKMLTSDGVYVSSVDYGSPPLESISKGEGIPIEDLSAAKPTNFIMLQEFPVTKNEGKPLISGKTYKLDKYYVTSWPLYDNKDCTGDPVRKLQVNETLVLFHTGTDIYTAYDPVTKEILYAKIRNHEGFFFRIAE